MSATTSPMRQQPQPSMGGSPKPTKTTIMSSSSPRSAAYSPVVTMGNMRTPDRAGKASSSNTPTTSHSSWSPTMDRLVGFDPLLEGPSKKDTLAHIHPPPLTEETNKEATTDPKVIEQLCATELREIAQQLGKEQHNSPMAPPLVQPSKKPTRKLPWQRHRRTKSLEKDPTAAFKMALPPRTHNRSATMTTAFTNALTITPPPAHAPSTKSQAVSEDFKDLTIPQLKGPYLAKPNPTSFLTGETKELMYSCELDPSPHQLEIPQNAEFLHAAKLCDFMEYYRRVDPNLDLNLSLVNVSRLALMNFVRTTNNLPTGMGNQGPPGLVEHHKGIVQSLLECGEQVELRGFFSFPGTMAPADDRREVAVFESQRQFIVVYRGTTQEQQLSKYPKTMETYNGVDIFSCFRNQSLDQDVFALLDRLTEESPFCDVVFTGHAFGGALATLASFHFSHARPMMRASCHVFGAPKPGSKSLRHVVNCLPNLKVMRVEYGQDPKCTQPSAQGGYHVGHLLLLSPHTKKPTVSAFKFDDNRHTHRPSLTKRERDVRAYVNALEELAQASVWVLDYVGQDGRGVRGDNNEARQMV